MEMPHFVYLIDGYFSSFHFFAVVNTAAVNIHVQVFVQTRVFISLGKIRGCGIAGLYGEFIFNFIRSRQFAFHSDFLLSTFCSCPSHVQGLDVDFYTGLVLLGFKVVETQGVDLEGSKVA